MTRPSLTLSVLDLVPAFGDANAAQALGQAVALAQTAETLGYRRYWAAEHHDIPGLVCPAPELLLAHIGARTANIRLGTGALLLPHYKPLKVAESFHMLASLYPGRIDLGIGRAPGGNAHVSMALSGNFLENVRRLPEKLRDVTALIRGDYTFEDQPVRAQPTPPVSPELWLLGTNAKSALYAAELGLGYVFGQFMSDAEGDKVIRTYRESFVPSAFLTAPSVIVAVSVICAETSEEARELARRTAGGIERSNPGQELDPAERKLIAGTPGDVRRRLQKLAATYQIDEFLVTTLVPDYELRLRSYELLAKELLSGN